MPGALGAVQAGGGTRKQEWWACAHLVGRGDDEVGVGGGQALSAPGLLPALLHVEAGCAATRQTRNDPLITQLPCSLAPSAPLITQTTCKEFAVFMPCGVWRV